MSHTPQRLSVHVSSRAVRAIRDGAVRVYAGDVTRTRGTGNAGDIAILYGPKDRPFALGVFDPHSPVQIRVLCPTLGETIDAEFLRKRVRSARARRQKHFDGTQTNGYRLIHGPGDGLPGLVVDRYHHTAVVKCYSHAWLPWLPTLVDALTEDPTLTTGILRLSRTLQQDKDLLCGYGEGRILWGLEETLSTEFLEHGIRFEVDPKHGQKTGFFLDQRENRQRVGALSAQKDVLNVFCYTGGFSLYAAQGGAHSVVSIDASQQAMDALERNLQLNPSLRTTHFDNQCADAFDAMARLRSAGRTFDIVIVDPPSFAKKMRELDNARGAYQRLAFEATSLTASGGIVVFASCSSKVSDAFLQDALQHGARRAHAKVDVFESTGHPIDHPIPSDDDQYLKCLYARVHR